MRSKLRLKEKSMKRTIAMSVVGFLLMSCALFAADGDLVVNGNLTAPGVIAQIQSVSPPMADISTTSTSFVDMGGMSITLTTAANSKLLIFWNASIYQNTAACWAITEAQVDGVRVGAVQGGYSDAGGLVVPIAGTAVAVAGAGQHTVKIRWRVSGGNAHVRSTTYPDYYGRTLTVMEIRQ